MDQQIVGINTKSIVWNWVIRKNVIDGAGTGIYLGNSDGEAEFVNGLIEHNWIQNTLGYNRQVKHQNGRATALGAPVNGHDHHSAQRVQQGPGLIDRKPRSSCLKPPRIQ